MAELLPLFVKLAGRRVLLVGGGAVAAGKLKQLLAAGAEVSVVSPEVDADIAASGVRIERRPFVPSDLDGVWLVVAAAPPPVNRQVADAAEPLRVFVNAVDDPAHATAFLSGVVRRDGVTVAISTNGDAPGMTALVREALDNVLPPDLDSWMAVARKERIRWKRQGVPMSARRPLLLEALNQLYRGSQLPGPQGPGLPIETVQGPGLPIETVQGPGMPIETVHANAEGPCPPTEQETAEPRPARGHVSLVGAGPGDPGLLTRHAIARLRKADLVLYDALVDERVLRIARRAQRFFVGKRAGRHTLSQQDIHAAMIGAAHRGRRVVRLKGGDPFVFGRGGEEALALIAAGVPFDIVPGVTSAVAAPALAGVPVTHRGVASAFLVVSGHDPEAFAASVRGLPTNGITLVVLMGLARRTDLGQILIEQGWSTSTPAALIAEASTPRQQVWRGTLGALADGTARVGSDGPALVVVGEVAAMALTHAEVARPRVAPAPDAEQASPGAYPAGNRG